MTETLDRRSELLERVIDHVVEHGIDGLTLRSLSQTTGSNNRMLLYYFGSRDDLIATALQHAARRFPRIMSVPARMADRSLPLRDRLDAVWRDLGAAENLPFHRLFFQVFGLASVERSAYQPLLDQVGIQWLDELTDAIAADGHEETVARRTAGQLISLWRGLQMALLSGIAADAIDRTAFDAHERICRTLP